MYLSSFTGKSVMYTMKTSYHALYSYIVAIHIYSTATVLNICITEVAIVKYTTTELSLQNTGINRVTC